MKNLSKTTSIILASTTLALLISIGGINVSWADHPLDEHGTRSGTYMTFWYDNSLNNLKVDGSTGQLNAKVAPMIDSARGEWNGQSASFSIYRDWSYSTSDNKILGVNLTSTGPSGLASYPNGANPAYVNYNTARDFTSTGGCTLWWVSNLEWLANHEFGHTIGLDHSSQWWSNHSVMYPSCVGGWEEVRSADASQFDDMY